MSQSPSGIRGRGKMEETGLFLQTGVFQKEDSRRNKGENMKEE